LSGGATTEERAFCDKTTHAPTPLLALIEDDGDIHARIWFLAARIRVVDDLCRVTLDCQWTCVLVVANVKACRSLHR